MEEYKIEKGIPIPNTKKENYPFKQMEVGDSIDLGEFNIQKRCLVLNYSRRFVLDNQEYATWKFKTKKIGDKLRIWRIK